jgi:NADH-quinone oxidoreductase subunit H
VLARDYSPLIGLSLMLFMLIATPCMATVAVTRRESGSWKWALLQFGGLTGIAYLLILPALLGLRPFEITGAAQEISSGPLAEYGGQFLALSQVLHGLTIFIGLALFTDLFLGGAGNPFTFLVKLTAVFLPCLLVHAVFPRWRIEQAVRYLWRWPALLALAGLVVTLALK